MFQSSLFFSNFHLGIDDEVQQKEVVSGKAVGQLSDVSESGRQLRGTQFGRFALGIASLMMLMHSLI